MARGAQPRLLGRKTVPFPTEQDLADALGRDVGATGIDRFVDGSRNPGPTAVQFGATAFTRGKIEPFRQFFEDLALGAGGIAAIGIGKTA